MSAKQTAAIKTQPDPFLEAKLRWRETAKALKPATPIDMLEVKAQYVAEKLGFEPEWIAPLRELRKKEKLNPILFADQAPQLAQNMLAMLKMMDVREYPAFAIDRENMHITLRNMAGLIRMAIQYAPPGQSQLDVSKMASGLDMMSSAIAVAGVLVDLSDCKAITGKDPPEFIT